VGRDRPPGRPRIGDCDDEPYLLPATLCQGDAFELSCPQLRLKVAKPSLNLHEQDPSGAVEDHIGSSPIWRGSDRHLEAHAPGPMRRSSDQLGQLELA